jgi:hypothetical protein
VYQPIHNNNQTGKANEMTTTHVNLEQRNRVPHDNGGFAQV